MASSGWYVAATLARSETLAQEHLNRQGFESFCPRFRKARRHARRVDHVMAPVFPGYLFVRFDRHNDPWRSINGTVGVMRLVGPSSANPQAMPEEAMLALRARCDNEIIKCVLPSMEAGQPVRLAAGPFADRLATIEHLDDRGRVRVLLNILGGDVSVQIPARDLVPV